MADNRVKLPDLRGEGPCSGKGILVKPDWLYRSVDVEKCVLMSYLRRIVPYSPQKMR